MKLVLSTLRELMPLLPGSARRFLAGYAALTSVLSLVDIAALMLLALTLGSVIQGEPVTLPVLGTVGEDGYVVLIVILSAIVVLKSALNLGLQWAATRRFASFELEIGDRLFDAYIRAPWTDRLSRNTSQLVRLADVGIGNTTSGFLLPLVTLPMLITSVTIIVATLFVIQPVTAALTLVYLGLIAATLYVVVSRKAVQAGRVNRDYSFKVASLMTDMVGALKEITLRDKASEVAAVVHSNRIHSTRARANIGFLGSVPRFVLDAALVGGFVLIGGVALLTGGPSAAVTSIALFGVAGFRLVPSLTSFQSIMSQTQSNIPHVRAVILDIAKSLAHIANAEKVGKQPLPDNPDALTLRNVSFAYPGAGDPAIRDVDLVVPLGSTLGLVGASGAGKSTLVDVILGLLVPSEGDIAIGGRPLEDVLGAWRSRVGYVPQDVALFDGTIAQNVALSWSDDADPDKVEQALRRAQMWEFVQERPGGIDGRIGDRGMALSGGQRQRLGIARALYSDPLVLVMDEATSALDTKTEFDVSSAIRQLRGEVTIISVAHRLSTIRESDQVCFMRDGTIAASGTFDEVVRAMPDFARQAALAGLT